MSIDHYTRLINKTEDYIEINLDKQVTLSDAAKNVNLSEYHFYRLFSKYSSETLKQFITCIKMERSAIFLAINSEISVTEIAFKYGYSSSSSYNRYLKSIMVSVLMSSVKSKNGKEIANSLTYTRGILNTEVRL